LHAVTAAGFYGHTEVMMVKPDEAVWARAVQLWFGAFAFPASMEISHGR
jgi:hypothetical protein